MRIAMVTDGVFPLTMGGLQSHSTNLAKHLALAGASVDVLVPSNTREVHHADLERSGASLHALEWRSLGPVPGHYVAELWRYSREVKEWLDQNSRHDWIYVQGLSGLALFSRRPHRTPIALNLHGLEMFQRAATIRGRMDQVILRPPARHSARNADLLFSLGAGITSILERLGVTSDRIVEQPVGIDPESKVSIPMRPGTPRKLVFIGRDERRKGLEELTAVAKGMTGRYKFEIHFVGPVPESRRIADTSFIYHGEIRNQQTIWKLASTCDIIVSPSFAEGMPTVILEGMASGLAVIATRVGAVPELVSSANGWLIEPGDRVGLSSALVEALTIPDERLLEMKTSSLSRITRRFEWPEIARQTIEILNARMRRTA